MFPGLYATNKIAHGIGFSFATGALKGSICTSARTHDEFHIMRVLFSFVTVVSQLPSLLPPPHQNSEGNTANAKEATENYPPLQIVHILGIRVVSIEPQYLGLNYEKP
jgi:hypothetical protein